MNPQNHDKPNIRKRVVRHQEVVDSPSQIEVQANGNADNDIVYDLDSNVENNPDSNPDPISGQPGAHPMGTGVGAAGVGSVATVVGSVVAGPIGAVVGAVVGSVVGGLAGKATAEQMNPSFEENHWREHYTSRPYVEKSATYEEYQQAYRVGYEGFDRYGNKGRNYSDIEPDLRRDYEANMQGGLTWEKAKPAVQDAWNRAAECVKQ
jgi:hypothetical protein